MRIGWLVRPSDATKVIATEDNNLLYRNNTFNPKKRSVLAWLATSSCREAKLDPTCLWDLALKEDPVPVYASTELGEPDECCN